MGEQRMWFLEMESLCGEDAVKTVGLATEDLAYSINLIGKEVAGLDSSFETGSTVGKCNQITSHATEKSFMKGRVNQCGTFHCCLILRNCLGVYIVVLGKILLHT